MGKVRKKTSLVAQVVKRLSTMWKTRVQSLGWEDLLEKEMATHSSILAWKIPWTEEPGRLQYMGSQRVGHDWETSLSFQGEEESANELNPGLCGNIEVYDGVGGKESQDGGDICIHIADSRCCAAETNTIL